MSSLVKVPWCLSYFQDSVLIVPFLLLFDFTVLLYSLLLCFLDAFIHYGFCQDRGHHAHYVGL